MPIGKIPDGDRFAVAAFSAASAVGRIQGQALDPAAGDARISDGAAWWPHGVTLWEHAPRLPVTATLSGAATSTVEFGKATSTTSTVRYLRYALNAADAVEAGDALLAGHPRVGMLNPDMQVQIRAGAPLQRIDVLAFGDTTATAEFIVQEGASAANARTAMRTFEFDVADNVLLAVLTTSPLYATHLCRLHLEGRSHA